MIKTLRNRRLFAIALAALICCSALFGAIGAIPSRTQAESGVTLGAAPVYTGQQPLLPGSSAAAVAASVDTSSRSAATAFYFDQYVNASTPVIGWTGNFESCNRGSTSTTFKNAVLQRIAFYRAMAGVPSTITLSSTYNTRDQYTALMMGKAGALSHDPPSTWPCYTTSGRDGARSSNLALGANGWVAIDNYMKDFGGGNGNVGHRRWLLYPQTQNFGTGDVPGVNGFSTANALWVFDTNIGGLRPATRDGFVAWPPSGYVPYQVVYPRWSLSYPDADFTNATVTMTTGSTTIPVTKEPVTDPSIILGEPTIAWRPNGIASDASWPQPAQDTRYTIKITGAIVGGQSKSFQYDVIVFDPSTNPPPPPAPVCHLDHNSARNGISIVESCTGFKGGETVDIFWERTSSTPLASFVADQAGAGSAAFKVPTSTGGIHRVIAKGRTSKTLDNLNFHVLSGISLSPKSGLSGSTFKVTLTGFGANETITIKWYLAGSSTVTLTSSLVASSTGGASRSFTVPNSSTGTHLVEASGNAGNVASYNFTVTGPAAASEPTKSPTPTPIASAAPSATVESSATVEPTATETTEPSPTETATDVPTEAPTEEPTATPTDEPPPTETAVPDEAPPEATV